MLRLKQSISAKSERRSCPPHPPPPPPPPPAPPCASRPTLQKWEGRGAPFSLGGYFTFGACDGGFTHNRKEWKLYLLARGGGLGVGGTEARIPASSPVPITAKIHGPLPAQMNSGVQHGPTNTRVNKQPQGAARAGPSCDPLNEAERTCSLTRVIKPDTLLCGAR